MEIDCSQAIIMSALRTQAAVRAHLYPLQPLQYPTLGLSTPQQISTKPVSFRAHQIGQDFSDNNA